MELGETAAALRANSFWWNHDTPLLDWSHWHQLSDVQGYAGALREETWKSHEGLQASASPWQQHTSEGGNCSGKAIDSFKRRPCLIYVNMSKPTEVDVVGGPLQWSGLALQVFFPAKNDSGTERRDCL